MPNRSEAKFLELAKKVLACEASSTEDVGAKALPGFHSCDKLRSHLSKVFGPDGFRPLLMRAVALVGAKCSWLSQLRVTAEGTLEGFAGLKPKLDRAALEECEVELIAELLALLVTFIGPTLTLSLVQEIWPTLGDVKLKNGTI